MGDCFGKGLNPLHITLPAAAVQPMVVRLCLSNDTSYRIIYVYTMTTIIAFPVILMYDIFQFHR